MGQTECKHAPIFCEAFVIGERDLQGLVYLVGLSCAFVGIPLDLWDGEDVVSDAQSGALIDRRDLVLAVTIKESPSDLCRWYYTKLFEVKVVMWCAPLKSHFWTPMVNSQVTTEICSR